MSKLCDTKQVLENLGVYKLIIVINLNYKELCILNVVRRS